MAGYCTCLLCADAHSPPHYFHERSLFLSITATLFAPWLRGFNLWLPYVDTTIDYHSACPNTAQYKQTSNAARNTVSRDPANPGVG